MKNLGRNAILQLTLLFAAASTYAATKGKTDIVVQTPSGLHQLEHDKDDLMLHADGSGSSYLYIEQEHGALLTVFDVTDAAHIKPIASVQTGARGVYDFVSPINDRYEMISFRDGSGTAVMDLRKAKAPRISTIEGIGNSPAQTMSSSGYLLSKQQVQLSASKPKENFQVVETTTKEAPRVLATINEVIGRVTRPETGTTFLLSDEGLTVVRSKDMEEKYALEEAIKSQN